jgi:hypothetical protein
VIRTACLAAWAAAALAAADGGAFEPGLLRMSASTATSILVRSGTSALVGNARIAYERLALEADRIDYALVQVPGLRQFVPSFIALSPPPGGRILIDTSGTELPRFPVRMRIAPGSARIDAAGRDGDRLRWRLTLDDPGRFVADIRGNDGTWLSHVFAAARIEVLVEAPVAGGALGGPVLREMRLTGRAAGAGTAREQATVRRYRSPVADPEAPPAETPAFAAQSDELVLLCDQDGAAIGITGGQDFSYAGLMDDRLPGFAPGAARPPAPSATR